MATPSKNKIFSNVSNDQEMSIGHEHNTNSPNKIYQSSANVSSFPKNQNQNSNNIGKSMQLQPVQEQVLGNKNKNVQLNKFSQSVIPVTNQQQQEQQYQQQLQQQDIQQNQFRQGNGASSQFNKHHSVQGTQLNFQNNLGQNIEDSKIENYESDIRENCPTHPHNIITNICCNNDCMEPLCPQCIKIHIELHKQSNTVPIIEYIQDKRQEAMEELIGDRQNLEKELELLGHFNEQGKKQMIEECHNNLARCKEAFIQKINEYFEDFENSLSQQISAHKFSSSGEINNLNQKLQAYIDSLKQMEGKLQSQYYIPDLLKVLSGELQGEYQNIHQEVDGSIDTFVQGLVDLQVNEQKLNQVEDFLDQYIQIVPYNFDHSDIADKKQHRVNFSQPVQRNFKRVQHTSNLEQQNFFPQNLNSNQNTNPNFDSGSKSENYQNQFFGDNQSSVRDNNYSNAKSYHKQRDESKKMKTQDLKISFKIPIYSRSIITPSGEIFVTGGIPLENKGSPTTSCYVLDYGRETLIPISDMLNERSEHGICYANNCLYVVGGEDIDGPTKRCERYDFSSNRWIEIAPLNSPATQCCIASFNDQEIYKFGGKQDSLTAANPIERYDIATNTWHVVEFSCQNEELFDLPNLSGAVQINGSEILVIGGVKNKQCLSTSLVFKIDPRVENAGTLYITKNMPKLGSFWSVPIVEQNILFSLQNVPLESNPEHSYFQKKSLLVFQGKNWKEIQ